MKLFKSGTGRLAINTTNTYTGETIVTDGALEVNGQLTASPVTLERGLWLNSCISGTGVLGGGLTVGQYCAVVPGATNLPGTLTVSNHLRLLGDTLAMFDLSNDPTSTANDRVIVFGNLSLAGLNTIAINALSGELALGQYNLISYTGTLTGSLTNLVLTGPFAPACVLTNPPGHIAVLVVGTRPPTNLVWRGAGGNQWDVGSSYNWLANGAVERFQQLDSVRFDDTGAALPIVNLVGRLTPSAVTVAATADYTFTGTGYISGQTGLVKSNSGTLTILTTNDYTGPTVINGGRVSVALLSAGGTPSARGAANSDPTNIVINGGTLRYFGNTVSINRGLTITAGGATLDISNATANLTLGGALVGQGGLTKTGVGGLTLTGANTFAGGLSVYNGTVTLGTTTAAGSGTITLNGGLLALNASGSPATYANPIHVASSSAIYSQGGNQALSGAWSGTGDLQIYIPSNNTFSVRGDMSGYSGRITLPFPGYFRWYGSTGSSQAAFDLGTSWAIMLSRDGGIIHLGALAGGTNTVLSGAGSTDALTTYVIGARGEDTTFAGAIRNGASTARPTAITKVGPGVLTLTGSNTYSGQTIVSGGTLLINGNHAAATNTVTVEALGRLGGIGIIGGATTVFGVLAPGAPLGTITFTNTLSLGPASTTFIEISKAPRTNDQVRALAGINYGGTLIVTNIAGALAAGDVFKLFDAPNYSGRFNAISLPPLAPELAWLTSKLTLDGTLRVIARPQLTASLTAGGLVLSCTNGPANEPCYVLTSTNLTLPVSAWTRIATNAFDAAGRLTITNAVGAEPQRFYLLQLQ
ncbi:MAG: autotransporter-associated beta strand repeat-containing protein [Verrucomicrobiae bacterium]|nr:autotransporter-associated beta strand repeat-containing protein [Verrucomicrobiae bacterium]